MVDLSFIFARSLCADDPHHIFVTPRVDDPINLRIVSAQRNPSNLGVIFPVVDALQHLVLEDGSSREKLDQVLPQIGSGLSLIPLECEVPMSPLVQMIHKYVHIMKIGWSFIALLSLAMSGAFAQSTTAHDR
jgi:hypothetical protein